MAIGERIGSKIGPPQRQEVRWPRDADD